MGMGVARAGLQDTPRICPKTTLFRQCVNFYFELYRIKGLAQSLADLQSLSMRVIDPIKLTKNFSPAFERVDGGCAM